MARNLARRSAPRSELFTTFLGNMAWHATLLTTEKNLVKISACFGQAQVCYRIEQKGERPDVWDQTYLVLEDGTEKWLGNRHAACEDYSRRVSEALWKWAEIQDTEVAW